MLIAPNTNGTVASSSGRQLAVLDQASRILADASTIEEITEVRNKAEAARTFAKAARLGLEIQNRAAELRLRAERKAGTFLAGLRLRGGARTSKGQRAPLKLEDLGISRDQSKRWQRLAVVSEADFRRFLTDINQAQREVTSAALLRFAGHRTENANDISRRHAALKFQKGDLAMGGNPTYELVVEVGNHCQLLANLLQPICESEPTTLGKSESRIVGRLIREMIQLIAQLERQTGETGPHRKRS